MTDEQIPGWRVSAKILCACCGHGIFEYGKGSSSNEGSFDEVMETDLPELLKQQMDAAQAAGWEINEEDQTALCDMCCKLPADMMERRIEWRRGGRTGYLGQGGHSVYADDDMWGWGGCGTSSHYKGRTISAHKPYEPPVEKVKGSVSDAAKEAIARIEAAKIEREHGGDQVDSTDTPDEMLQIRDLFIDAQKTAVGLKTLTDEKQTKAAIEANSSIKEIGKKIDDLIKALEDKKVDVGRMKALRDRLMLVQAEIVKEYLGINQDKLAKAKKKKPKKKRARKSKKKEPEKKDDPVEEGGIVPGSRVIVKRGLTGNGGEFPATVRQVRNPSSQYRFYVERDGGVCLAVEEECVRLAGNEEGG